MPFEIQINFRSGKYPLTPSGESYPLVGWHSFRCCYACEPCRFKNKKDAQTVLKLCFPDLSGELVRIKEVDNAR